MSWKNYIFTSKSVSEGRPDKLCDRISYAVLDAFLNEEPKARVACDTFATTSRVVIGGEVGLSSKTKLVEYMANLRRLHQTYLIRAEQISPCDLRSDQPAA